MQLADLRRSKRLWQRRAKKRSANVTKQRQQLSAAKSALHRARGLVARRTKQINALDTGPQTAVKWALAQAGTVEHPAGSNRGPKVSAYQRNFGMDGVAWCGCFVGSALLKAGIKVTARIAYCPSIVSDAQAGRNGLAKVVPVSQAKAGDLVVYKFGSGTYMHVGMVRKPYDGKGFLATVEGNTSAGTSGSQSNGGGVFLRTRPVTSDMAIVRPRWS